VDIPHRVKPRSNPGDEGAHPDDVASHTAPQPIIKLEPTIKATPDKDQHDEAIERHSGL
jgi:hypothetical protein